MTVKLYFYDSIKDSKQAERIAEASYRVGGYKVICGGSEAIQIESETDEDGRDPNHTYLVLESRTGATSTFRYSYTDIVVEA